MIQVMFTAPIELMYRFLPPTLERGEGAVINVSSLSQFWSHTSWNTLYAATKRGLVLATRSLEHEYGERGVIFTAVCPGVTRTEMTSRSVAADDMARYPGFLVADPTSVAEAALEAVGKGKSVVVPGWANRILASVVSTLPNRIVSGPLAQFLGDAYRDKVGAPLG
jgi:short-subunit dehydrogenase